MGRSFKVISTFLVILVLIPLPGVTLQAQVSGAGQPAASHALFLEHYLVANGSVVKGEAPFRSVNFPTYWYNENTKQIHGKVNFSVNDSLIMVFGDVLTLKGNFGAGTGNRLYGVYGLPVYADRAYVYYLDTRGNVYLYLNGKNIVLKPGDSYAYHENGTLKDHEAVINITYDQTYVNHGFIDKRTLGGGTASPAAR